MLPFTKMHGAGNDYVYVDAIRDDVPAGKAALAKLARRVSDRHTGVGADGLIVLAKARSARADVRMAMFNADGSESEMCGNGIRCLAKLAFDHGHVAGPEVRVETGAGVLAVTLEFARGRCHGATVRMGRPRLTPSAVPVELQAKGPLMRLAARVAGQRLTLHAVGMGNPHAVCFVDDPETFPVATVGPLLEHDPRFPRRTNVEFVARAGSAGGLPVLRQRTWERGSGETQACGTGACATVVAAILTGAIRGRAAVVRLNGGDLRIGWADDQAEVVMSGPAQTVFTGVWGG
jgi:diaminopimelate epimerase